MGTTTGAKIARSHTTATSTADIVAREAEKLPEVTKVILDIIIPGCRPGRRGIKFLPIDVGVLAKVRGPSNIQHLYIYTKDPDATKRHLENLKIFN